MIELLTKDGLVPVTLGQVDAMLTPSRESLMKTCAECRFRKMAALAQELATAAERARKAVLCEGCVRGPKECAKKCFHGDLRPVYDELGAALAHAKAAGLEVP